LRFKLPIVFLSVSATVLLAYLATLALSHGGVLPTGLHMLWGLFVIVLVILLQCLVFGFFIGSGKTIKRVVAERGLDPAWIQRTKDYKNRSYPALMLALVVTAAAGIAGGGIGAGAVPVAVHVGLVWLAFLLNVRSLWVSYRVLVENVGAIHAINREVGRREGAGMVPEVEAGPAAPPEGSAGTPPLRGPFSIRNRFHFFAAAGWIPFLYIKFALGSRDIPWWPFLLLSLVCLSAGRWSGKERAERP
jgi:hypothetical protein